MDKIDGLKDIMDLKLKLIEETTHQFNKGVENVNAAEATEVIDMIKDLAEAEEKCMKACYYKKIIESMEEVENENYGYNPNRDSMGRYTSGNGRRGLRYPNVFWENNRMGYEAPTRDFQDYMVENNMEKWRNARRHYQSSHSKADKDEMDTYAKSHLSETMATLKEIMANSDPELQRKMKNDLTNLINDIT